MTDSEVHCKTCASVFSLASGGKNDIEKHIKSIKHQKALQQPTKPEKAADLCEGKMTDYLKVQFIHKKCFYFQTEEETDEEGSDSDKTKRRSCVFNSKLAKMYPFLVKTKSDSDVHCNLCYGDFTVVYQGITSIKIHIESKKHQKALLDASNTQSKPEQINSLLDDTTEPPVSTGK